MFKEKNDKNQVFKRHKIRHNESHDKLRFLTRALPGCALVHFRIEFAKKTKILLKQ